MVPDVSTTSPKRTTFGVGKSGHLIIKPTTLEAESREEKVSSTTNSTVSRESCEVGKNNPATPKHRIVDS